MSDPRPIGLFDSGVGGLTVLEAVARRLPVEDLLYLGDTARLPYGTKSKETVRRYATRAVELPALARRQGARRGVQHGDGARARRARGDVAGPGRGRRRARGARGGPCRARGIRERPHRRPRHGSDGGVGRVRPRDPRARPIARSPAHGLSALRAARRGGMDGQRGGPRGGRAVPGAGRARERVWRSSAAPTIRSSGRRSGTRSAPKRVLIDSAESVAAALEEMLPAASRRAGNRPGTTHLLVTDASERLRRVAPLPRPRGRHARAGRSSVRSQDDEDDAPRWPAPSSSGLSRSSAIRCRTPRARASSRRAARASS